MIEHHPLAKKQKPSQQSAAHDVVSGSVAPESAEDCPDSVRERRADPNFVLQRTVADVAHGWLVFVVVGVYSMIRSM